MSFLFYFILSCFVLVHEVYLFKAAQRLMSLTTSWIVIFYCFFDCPFFTLRNFYSINNLNLALSPFICLFLVNSKIIFA